MLWKHALCVGGTVAATALAAGCGSSSDDAAGTATSSGTGTTAAAAAKKPLKLGVFLLAKANTYSMGNLKGVQEAADAAGDVDLQVFDGKFDGAAQLDQIQDAAATGTFDGFVIFPNNGAQVAPAVEAAAKQGVKSVAAYAQIGPDISTGVPQVDGVVGTAWPPLPVLGQRLGELTAQACEKDHPDADPCEVAFINGGNQLAWEQLKLKHFKTAIATSGRNIKLVATGSAGYLVEPALKFTQNMLVAHPGLDVVASTGDQMTTGAEQAAEKAGKDGISMIGVGASEQGVEAAKADRWFATVVTLPQTEGRTAGKMLIDELRGTPVATPDFSVFTDSPVGDVYDGADASIDFTGEWSV